MDSDSEAVAFRVTARHMTPPTHFTARDWAEPVADERKWQGIALHRATLRSKEPSALNGMGMEIAGGVIAERDDDTDTLS